MRGKYFLPSAQIFIVRLIFCCFLLPAFIATAKAQGAPLILLSEETSTRALALESVTLAREPFPLNSFISWSPDRRTRVIVFALNLQLQPGDDLSTIIADAEDEFHRHYALTVEAAAPVPGQNWMSSLTLRLSNEMEAVGDVLLRIKYQGRVSNRVRIGIGHIGGGPNDDVGSKPTSPYLIRGSVTAAGVGLAGTAVTLQGSDSVVATVTNSNGQYLIATVGGDYILSAAKPLFDFSPPSHSFVNLGNALDGINFTATRQRRTVQGIVRDESGVAIPNIEMTLTGGDATSRKTTTDVNGLFTFPDVTVGFAYTVSPTGNAIFTFTGQNINELTETTTLMFSGLRRTYTISGRVLEENAPLANAVVTLHQTGATSLSDAFGNYSFSGLPAGFNYALSVSKPYYDFSPLIKTFNNLSQTFDDVNYFGTRQKREILGITRDDTGQALPNVQMTLTSSGAPTRTAITDNMGVFSFYVPAEFAYTVSAGHKIFAFTPQTIDQLTATTALTFSGLRRSYTIGGRVLNQNAAVAGAMVTLQESGATSISDASGNYSFSVKAGFDYTLLAARQDYTFDPASVLLTQVDGNRQVDLEATPHVFLRGRIVDQNGRGLFGVKVNISGTQSGVAATAADGSYSFLVTAFGNYTLSPWKEQDYYSFTPNTAALTALEGSRTAEFSAVLNAAVPSSYVLEFDGSPKSVDYSMPILTPVLDYNLFWPDGLNFGHFFWEFWAMPGTDAGGTYMISDGYGGAHAILFGVANFGSREPNRYQLIGNIWNGSSLTYFGSDEGPAPYEWGHFAAGWDGTNIVIYYNGVPVGSTPWVGPRMTPGGIQGCGRLLIGGSDHSNFVGRIAQVRGYEQSNPREAMDQGIFATFAPQTVFAVDGNLLSYFFRPSENIADLSLFGQYGRQHAGLLRNTSNGVLYPCPGCPLPQFVLDPTAPDFSHPNNPGTPPAPVDTPPPVPGGALIFDSFSRRNSTYALGGLGGLGSTEGGTAGTQTWQTNQAAGQLQPFGILNGRAVLLANATAVAWTNAPAGLTDLDIRVDRHAGFWGTGQNTGLSFRVTDSSNYFFAYSADGSDSSQPQELTVGYYAAGVRTDLTSAVSLPASWTTLRVVTTGAGAISVYADDALLYSTTNNLFSNSTGAGVFNRTAGLALTNRWDNFRVFSLL